MNRTQDTIILEKIFNERLELSIYKNRGQFYLTKNLRKQFRHKILMNVDMPVGNTLPDMVITIILCLIAGKLIPEKNQKK